jgi:hypothetical protein
MSIQQIAYQEGKEFQHVMDTVDILDLSKTKQKQIKDGSLNPKEAVKALNRLMNQAGHELPNHILMPIHIAPSSRQFIPSLLMIHDFLDYVAGMNLTEYPPELRASITQMATNFAKDYAKVDKAWDEWQADVTTAESNDFDDEEADDKNGKEKTKVKAKGRERNKVKLELLPDTNLLPDEQKAAAK